MANNITRANRSSGSNKMINSQKKKQINNEIIIGNSETIQISAVSYPSKTNLDGLSKTINQGINLNGKYIPNSGIVSYLSY